MAASPIDDVEIRAYFAAVVGGFRQPFGKRGSTGSLGPGQSRVLAQNSTADRVLSVLVSRSDLAGATASVIFSQSNGGASQNDFSVSFDASGSQRFVLKPSETLSVAVISGGPATFVVGQETW